MENNKMEMRVEPKTLIRAREECSMRGRGERFVVFISCDNGATWAIDEFHEFFGWAKSRADALLRSFINANSPRAKVRVVEFRRRHRVRTFGAHEERSAWNAHTYVGACRECGGEVRGAKSDHIDLGICNSCNSAIGEVLADMYGDEMNVAGGVE